MASELVDLQVVLHHETEKAVLVSLDGDRKKAKWFPKSIVDLTHVKGSVWEMTLPVQKAYEEGFI